MNSSLMSYTIALALMMGSFQANASTAEALSLDALTAQSELIFEGVVTETESEWHGDLIITRAIVDVSDCLMGACQARQTVIQVGGQVGDIVMEVSGSLLLSPGEEVVLFTREQQHVSGFVPVGLSQGVFYVDGNDLSRRIEDVVLVTPEGHVHSITGIPASLDVLRAAVQR